MPRYEATCEQCGNQFSAYRKPSAPAPRFCSYDCYWASGGPRVNAPNWQRRHDEPDRKVKHRVKVYVGRDANGKPRYVQRSHWVWDQHHPDDPVQPGDHIHHKDGDKTNDDPSNLEKKPGGLHLSEHAQSAPEAQRRQQAATLRAYHAANPGKQRKGESHICPVCGNEFYRPPSAPRVTCSYVCSGKWSARKRKENQ